MNYILRKKLKFLSLNCRLKLKEIKMESLLHYSPILVAVMIFLIQQRIVVTPEQLEKKHREIIEDIEERFVSIHSFNDLKDHFGEMKEKIDKIYDFIITVK